jgi:hypothetical protein
LLAKRLYLSTTAVKLTPKGSCTRRVHTLWGGDLLDATKGLFDFGTDLEKLAGMTRGQIGKLQVENERTSFVYTVVSREIVGMTKDGVATNVFRAFRNPFGMDPLTMFPVAP